MHMADVFDRLDEDECWVWAFDFQRQMRWTHDVAKARPKVQAWLWRINAWRPLLELGERAGSMLMDAPKGGEHR